MTYIRVDFLKYNYQPKDGKKTKTFDALEWLAAMCSHVPNRGEQMIRYYGHYSNVFRANEKHKNQMMSFRTCQVLCMGLGDDPLLSINKLDSFNHFVSLKNDMSINKTISNVSPTR